jgi:hypothetical protein
MACPTCRSRLHQIPAVYPTWHCQICGTLMHGSEEELTISTPAVLGALIDSEGKCLRDDAAMCVCWQAMRAILTSRRVDDSINT